MEFRVITKEEFDMYWELRLHGLREHPELFSGSYEEFVNRPLTEVMEIFPNDDHHFVLGAFDEQNMLMGIAGFRQEKGLKMKHKASIWGVYVNPDSQGGGVGRQLIQAMIDKASTISGLEQLLLTVVADNEKAKSLYKSIGFKEFGTEPHSLKIGNGYVDEEHMVLFL
ncbi:GNAT family N-acetyltransferase [Bacillus sp. 165]|uniref:GNAT family N-acetyltransferase n=1 Tax=Bacillus sp. 165 TaxID=1529117 RepID=UPI001ADCE031|nr:GNAT family N-acetyltransferase [Bacillus sp. 165]MBO9129711.1 GNAT family N-acetyltransferase [Bacillus sp. 165]